MKSYFTFGELIKTDTGLPNYPSVFDFKDEPIRLECVLSILRHLAGCPIIVNSAFRTKEVNKAVGGSPDSFHLKFRAADITCSDNSKLSFICNKWFECGILEEFIVYENFIHIAI